MAVFSERASRRIGDNTQNFNRYGYVYNNPLMYTDPSGEVFVPILIGAAVAAATYTVTALTADIPFTLGGVVKSTLIGAASGAISFGISESTAAISQLGTRITVQALAQGGFQGSMAGVQGGNFWQAFASGALASIAASTWSGGTMAKGGSWGGIGGKFAKSGVGQITFGTISGGGGAALSGGNFWEGAITGFAVSSVNYLASDKKLASPTGKGIRNDSKGLGHYGAPRTHGAHKGLDFQSVDGQDIISPIDGKVRNFYGVSSGYPMLQIYPSDPNIGFDYIEILYVNAPSGTQSWVLRDISAGATIGTAANLQGLGYSQGVTPHIHLQIWKNGTRIDPTPFFFKR